MNVPITLQATRRSRICALYNLKRCGPNQPHIAAEPAIAMKGLP